MDSLLTSAAEFIARNAVWAGAILGAVTFFESLVVIGAFVPATGLLVAAGGWWRRACWTPSRSSPAVFWAP
ncbi:hypothetical protein [Brevundimonas naejangsanensis]|uniref:hypothetical protein n=1 Tax=Brevundimonas naejangsanensis TaxID=588932 RepID=UPI001F09A37A|nr:hypothetical protein [Brevundimonas naejangsanensis]